MSERDGDPPASFEDRLAGARRRQGLDAPPVASAAGGSGGGNALSIGLRVGVEMVSAMVVATAIGWWLDRQFGMSPLFLVLFVLLGGAAGVANVWRLMAPKPPPKV